VITKAAAKNGVRERQRIELGAVIYETALDHFRAHGFEDTTVQQITVAAGIAKGTFFNHFPSKDHVLQAWYREITRSALADMADRSFESGGAAILALVVRMTRDVASDPDLWDAKAGATSREILRREEADLDEEVFAFLKQAIERDMADGLMASGTDAQFLTEMILTVLTGTAHSWTVSSHSFDLAETIAARIGFVLGAASNPGVE